MWVDISRIDAAGTTLDDTIAVDRYPPIPELDRRSGARILCPRCGGGDHHRSLAHKWLFVIARSSSFTYKAQAVDVKRVGRELGVRYVVEGGVRKAGERVRISAQLIEAETGTHVWAERYDGRIDDIFALQDEITLNVIGAIEPSLRDAEIERV